MLLLYQWDYCQTVGLPRGTQLEKLYGKNAARLLITVRCVGLKCIQYTLIISLILEGFF